MAQVLVVGVGSFDSDDASDDPDPLAPSPYLDKLPSVAPAVNSLAVQMAKTAGLRVLGGEATLDPDAEALGRLWLDALGEMKAGTDSDALIVHFAGHGVAGKGHHSLFLATRQTTLNNLPRTAPQIGSWLEQVECATDGPPVLFILDVCGAGRPVMQQLVDGIRAADRRAWVIAACAPDEKTYQARFTWAVGLVLERLREGRLDISPTVEYVPVETLAREIDRELVRSAAAEDRPSQSVLRTVHAEARLRIPPFLSNPSYRESPGGQFRQTMETGLWQFAAAVDPALDPLHFISRASGMPQQQDVSQGCFFTGREEQLGRIKQWLEGPAEPSLTVVTGSPGSGKSALLGVAACLAHPQLREVTRQIAQAVPRQVRPEPNPDLAAVHARQRGPSEVLSSVASQLGLGEEPGRGWTATALLDRIASQRTRPVTIIVDALDEASLDLPLLWEVLIPLAQARRRHEDNKTDMEPVLCRVLIGTRPWWDKYAALHGVLDSKEQLIDLDEITDEQQTAELTDYLCDILETSHAYSGLGTSAMRQATARAVAEQLAERQDSGNFLLASLFAHYLIHQNEAPAVEQVVRRIPWDLPEMLDLHLEVLEREHPTMRAVLAAVAHGYGQGMPLEVIHQAAEAFTERRGERLELGDTRRALQAASFYLRFSTDIDGQRLYRFYHQSLVDHLRSKFDHVRREEISERILGTVPGPASITARRFGLAQPYVLRHAAQHAADAGQLEHLLHSASFLVHCDPQLLYEHLSTKTLRGHILGLISQAALSPVHEPWQRREWLRNTAVVWGETWLVDAVDALDEPTVQPTGTSPLSLVWGTAEQTDFEERFAGANAVLVRCAERWLAVCDSGEGHLDVWDVRTGLQLFSLGYPDDSPVTSWFGKQFRDGALMAVGTAEGHVYVWDLNVRELRASIQTDAVPVVALGLVEQGDRTLIVVCGGGEVTAYDLSGDRASSLDVVAGWLSDLEAEGNVDDLFDPDLDIKGYDCTAVGAMTLDGAEVFVAGAADGSVHLWEPDGRRHRTWPGGGSAVHGVHVLEGPGGPLLVTESEEAIWTWDVRTGTHVQLPGVRSSTRGTVVFDEDARPCWAHLGAEHEILLQPLDDAAEAAARLCALPRSVSRLTALAADPSMAGVALTGSPADPLSRQKWKLLSEGDQDGGRALLWKANHVSPVERVSVSDQGTSDQVTAVSADELGNFHVRDVLTSATLFSGYQDEITAVATGRLSGADVVVIGQGRGKQSIVHVMHPDGTSVFPPLNLLDTALDLVIGDIEGKPALIAHTIAGILSLIPGDQEPLVQLYAREADGIPITSFARGRRGAGEVMVVIHEWHANRFRDRSFGKLVVESSISTEPRMTVDLTERFACLATGRWGDRDAAAVGHLEGTVVVICLVTGHELARLQAHDGPVATVTFIRHHENARLVTSGEVDSTIRLWDPQHPGVLVAETSFPDSLGAVSVGDAGVFAGFGTRVAYFTWNPLRSSTDSCEGTENR